MGTLQLRPTLRRSGPPPVTYPVPRPRLTALRCNGGVRSIKPAYQISDVAPLRSLSLSGEQTAHRRTPHMPPIAHICPPSHVEPSAVLCAPPATAVSVSRCFLAAGPDTIAHACASGGVQLSHIWNPIHPILGMLVRQVEFNQEEDDDLDDLDDDDVSRQRGWLWHEGEHAGVERA
jgi:hypothetical protein